MYRSAGLYCSPFLMSRAAAPKAGLLKSIELKPSPSVGEPPVTYHQLRQLAVADAPTGAHHGLVIQLIGDAEPRTKGIRIGLGE